MKSDALFILDYICDRVLIESVKNQVPFDKVMSKLNGESDVSSRVLRKFLSKKLKVLDRNHLSFFSDFFEFVLVQSEKMFVCHFDTAPI